MLKLDREQFLNWHPRYEMTYNGTRNLFFKPDFENNRLIYIVTIWNDNYKIDEHRFDTLDDALNYYNE